MIAYERKVKDLIPYEFNSRFNEKTIDKLSKSIEDYGYVVPIVIDKNNVVVTGHARLKAIKELGWKKLVVELRGLQEIASDFDLKVNVALETSYGSLDADVTEFDIEKQENKFETTFTDRSIEANAKLIKVSCEHCGANFGIDSEKL